MEEMREDLQSEGSKFTIERQQNLSIKGTVNDARSSHDSLQGAKKFFPLPSHNEKALFLCLGPDFCVPIAVNSSGTSKVKCNGIKSLNNFCQKLIFSF